jgi:hypothetical protein
MHGELKTESMMNIEGSQGLYKVGSPAGGRRRKRTDYGEGRTASMLSRGDAPPP